MATSWTTCLTVLLFSAFLLLFHVFALMDAMHLAKRQVECAHKRNQHDRQIFSIIEVGYLHYENLLNAATGPRTMRPTVTSARISKANMTRTRTVNPNRDKGTSKLQKCCTPVRTTHTYTPLSFMPKNPIASIPRAWVPWLQTDTSGTVPSVSCTDSVDRY